MYGLYNLTLSESIAASQWDFMRVYTFVTTGNQMLITMALGLS